MDIIKEQDPVLANEIREHMFTFEDIVKVDRKGIQKLVDSIPRDVLMVALKKSTPGLREKIYTGMPRRTAMNMENELMEMPRIRAREVEKAQREIVDLVVKLRKEGQLRIEKEVESTT